MCETCGKVYKSKVGYSCHIKMHLRKQSNAVDLYHHCDKCDKKFVKPDTLQHHIKSAHEDLEYKCSLCPMLFKTIGKLKAHTNIAHSTDEKYQCKHCGKRLGSLGNLMSHEFIHAEANLQCKFCPKKFKRPNNLQFHERHHTGEFPFKCTICNSAFVSGRALAQHTKGVHKVMGPRGGKTGWWGKTKPKQ